MEEDSELQDWRSPAEVPSKARQNGKAEPTPLEAPHIWGLSLGTDLAQEDSEDDEQISAGTLVTIQ